MMVRAHAFKLGYCSDPECGPHILAEDADGKPICEIVIGREQALVVIKHLQKLLYDRATERDE